jgi:hypothetical protein
LQNSSGFGEEGCGGEVFVVQVQEGTPQLQSSRNPVSDGIELRNCSERIVEHIGDFGILKCGPVRQFNLAHPRERTVL